MKVIVADKISERGVELLKQTGWNIVLTTKDTLLGELGDADALIVAQRHARYAGTAAEAPQLRVVGRAESVWITLTWTKPPSVVCW